MATSQSQHTGILGQARGSRGKPSISESRPAGPEHCAGEEERPSRAAGPDLGGTREAAPGRQETGPDGGEIQEAGRPDRGGEGQAARRGDPGAASPGSGSANPRKFSEKIALHTQRQAEETRVFEQLMTDLTLSRVQFQKLQQLRLTQYHGGSLPNVSQLRSSASAFQPSFHQADNVRGTRHHGLVERPARNRFHPLHRRSGDKPARQFDGGSFGANYSSPPLDESWPRQHLPWKEEKHPGFRLTSALNRTNSDSALHTSALSTKPQDPYGGGGQSAWPAQYLGCCDGENDGHGEVVSFPGPLKEENLLNVPKPLPKQLWETKEIQNLSGRPRSCDVGGGNAFPHNGQNIGLLPFLGTLNTGGSLPDLTNLHYSEPLPASLDTGDHLFGSMSMGNSVGNLPAAMTHLGIRGSSGLQSSRSNPSIQATLSKTSLSSSLNSHPQTLVPSASALHPSLRSFSRSNPSLSTTNLSGPSRRRQTPVSPLTLSSSETHQGFNRQLSSTSPLNPYPASQMVPSDRSPLAFLPSEAQAQVSPPPPYPNPQELHQPVLQQPRPQEPPAQQPQSASALPQSDFQLLTSQGSSLTSFFPDVGFDQQAMRAGQAFLQQAPLVQQGHREPQDSFHLRSNLYSNCGNFPNNILTEDSSTSLFKDLSSALAGMPEVSLNVDNPFPLEDELQIEPLSLDGLNMLSDSSMGLLDPSVEETFRADRL
ncbi:PREDICTED: CREB-regulated transcription coactivator 3 [Elephantulus edwardii]|uniref:CREB-regulated transcription coactivator 3 n=1 Tax=Elephantulus edwardii TaxID=28737 RepID=UPI0003F0BE0D|nr:PREDICTED: CREB-regulated transcription coactivator 3 [Elephantulus edwardii]